MSKDHVIYLAVGVIRTASTPDAAQKQSMTLLQQLERVGEDQAPSFYRFGDLSLSWNANCVEISEGETRLTFTPDEPGIIQLTQHHRDETYLLVALRLRTGDQIKFESRVDCLLSLRGLAKGYPSDDLVEIPESVALKVLLQIRAMGGTIAFDGSDRSGALRANRSGLCYCPECNHRLVSLKPSGFSGPVLVHCLSCGGFWLDEGNLAKVRDVVSKVEARRVGNIELVEEKTPNQPTGELRTFRIESRPRGGWLARLLRL